MFEYITAGESHGPALTTIIKNLPSGLVINLAKINNELTRRQQGYGRGKRMEIEQDKVKISSGLRNGKTLGTPLTMTIKNKDWENWKKIMSITENNISEKDKVTKPRPGHADLAGLIKYNFNDIRNVLERASARETAARTAVGSVCRQFLNEFNIKIKSHVTKIASISAPNWTKIKKRLKSDKGNISKTKVNDYFHKVENSPLRCGDKEKTQEMIELINHWKENGDSAGGVIEIIVFNLPVGLGSHTHWDKKLDGKLAAALMSIQAIKGVEIGNAFENATKPGSKVHDEIYYDHNKYFRKTNRAGGLEGGITNGENLVIRIAMKPIPTLAKALHSVDINTKKEVTAAKERSDICAVPSASIVAEAVTASVLAKSFSEKFAGDSLNEIKNNFNSYQNYIKNL